MNILGAQLDYRQYLVSRNKFSGVVCVIVDENREELEQFEKDINRAGYLWVYSQHRSKIVSVRTNHDHKP